MTNLSNAALAVEHLNIWYSNSSKLPYDDEASADVIATFNGAVMGRLFSIDENLQLKPDKLESFSYNQSTYTYTLTLQKNLRFHNGREATASDLEFSIIRGLFSTKKSFYNLYLTEVVGIENISSDRIFHPGSVRGIQVEDSRTLKVTLKHNNPNFIYMFCKGYFSLVPQEELQGNYISWKKYPIGVGFYKVKNVNLNDGYVDIEANPGDLPKNAPKAIRFWTKMPKIEKIHIVPADRVETLPDSQKKNFNKFEYELPDSVSMFMFNNVHSLAKDINFRKFLYFAFDRNKLSKYLEGSKPIYENVPDLLGGGNISFPSDSATRARAYLQKIRGFSQDKTLKILIFGKQPEKLTDKYKIEIKAQLENYGLKVNYIYTEEKFLSKVTAELAPVLLVFKIADFFEPRFLFASMLKASPYIYQRSEDPKMDEFYQRINEEIDKKEKYNILKKLSEYTVNQVYENPLVEAKAIVAYDPNVIASLGKQMEPLSVRFEKISLITEK